MAAAVEGSPAAEKQCQVCRKQAAKYCCPRCQHRTCSLECVQAHKDASGCTGKRDRTAFVGRGEFDERTFLSDYRFLEEVQLADDVAKRSKPPAPKLDMPQFLQTLVYQARRRGVQLHILSPGMEKRRTNTTRYDGRSQTLGWHVEWRFPAAAARASDSKVHENTVIADLLARHLALQPGAATKYHTLREYGEAGLPALTVLMRKERTPANAVEYFEIDVSRPLRQQLAGKVLVEFPTFLVLLPREREDYIILPPPAAPAAGGAAAEPGAKAAAQPAAAEPGAEPAAQAAAAEGAGIAKEAQAPAPAGSLAAAAAAAPVAPPGGGAPAAVAAVEDAPANGSAGPPAAEPTAEAAASPAQ